MKHLRLIFLMYLTVLFWVGASPVLAQTELALVKVIALGGTIANTPGGRISGEAYVQAIPEIKKYARLEAIDLMRVASQKLTPKHWLKIAKTINEIFAKEKEVKGIVITQGSNTLADTAYFLNLVVKSNKPVVFVGAQRRFTTLSSDSPKNFVEAVRVATSDKAVGMGALVVLNDIIQAARDARKTMGYRLETYDSGDLGYLGYVDDYSVEFYRKPIKKHTTATEFDVSGIEDLPRVDILYSYAGASGDLLEWAVEQGKAKGIVIAAFPTGATAQGVDPFEPFQDAVAKKLVKEKGIPIVLTNRGGIGRITDQTKRRPHYIYGDNLVPQKAAILLMLALTKTKDRKEIQRMFREY
jgi:L-asparaginase